MATTLESMRSLFRQPRETLKYHRWLLSGKPLPPPHMVKQSIVREFGDRFGLSVLIETGTYQGDMVAAQLRNFEEIYSIELDLKLFQQAQQRFLHCPQIHLRQGDSGKVLGELVPQLQRPSLFWLDGHYSGGRTAQGELDTPILQELTHIFQHPLGTAHKILIDDARLFLGKNDYPTLQAVFDLASQAGYEHRQVSEDIILLF